MEEFIVSARKYRPLTFDSVIGQKSITQTLRNAIRSNHLAHAYLFCGPRGVGKTTCARIFAKTINCFQLVDFEACNTCESCQAFNEGRSYNIHELDAASNNSVEDIRTLIDQVRIPPQIGTHSVYIIDEVHMLSSAAFNAFLKTLEEPPRHAIFILATTEKHKIQPTIISRCQIFDFSRIGIEDTVEHLAYVAKKEGITADPDGLNVIANKADGAMRDALSLFDQIVSFAGNSFTYKDVIDNLNVLDYDYYFRLTDSFLDAGVYDALLIFDEILNRGFDGHHFIAGLCEHFRNLLVCTDPITVQLLQVGAGIKEKYKQQAARCKITFLIEALKVANECDLQFKISSHPRLLVELALMKLCQVNMSAAAALTAEKKTTNEPLNTTQSPVSQKNSETKPEPEQRTVIPTIRSVAASYSNKGAEDAKPLQASEPETQPLLNQPVAPEGVLKAWQDFALRIKSSEPRLYTAMTAHAPVLKEGLVIEVALHNQLQVSLMEGRLPDLLNYLKAQLRNSSIRLEFSLVPPEPEKKPMSVTERYDFLKEKNAAIDDLQQRFGLELSR